MTICNVKGLACDGIPDDGHLDSSDEDLRTNGKYIKETKLVTSFGRYIPLSLSIFIFHLFLAPYEFIYVSNIVLFSRGKESDQVGRVSAW